MRRAASIWTSPLISSPDRDRHLEPDDQIAMNHFSTVYYVRHGENEANVAGVFSNRLVDHSLTERGRRQADEVAGFLSREYIGSGAIYASPLRRAQETARPIAEALGRPIEVIEEFREVDMGELEGTSGPEAVQCWWETIAAWVAGDVDRRFPGGESHSELTKRLKAGFQKIANSATDGPQVVVAHAGLLRIGFRSLAVEAPPERLHIPNCSVSRFAIPRDGSPYRFDYWARHDYLSDPTPAAFV